LHHPPIAAPSQRCTSSWRAAYAGILDPAFLASLTIDAREASWRQVLAAGESELLIALEGSSAVGFASLGRARDEDAPPGRGELLALYVHPQSWSTGAGRQLWHAALARLHSRGFSSVSLWVLERNIRAIGFYSAAGFAVDAGSEKEVELGGMSVREVRMVHAS
jgi:ribosomal protein S18 acetylase RimI-like enzyme